MAYDTDDLSAAYGNPAMLAQGAQIRALRAAQPRAWTPNVYRSGDPINMGLPPGIGKAGYVLGLGGLGAAAAAPVVSRLKQRPAQIEAAVRRAEQADNEEQR